MKLIHLSDLHIGKRANEFSMLGKIKKWGPDQTLAKESGNGLI